ncbi:MAG: pentapeptide repeat-containing protein, partial [Actinotalea sp.]|nr:pentapeptide repeat-containing protein [Actinotalea sp.]
MRLLESEPTVRLEEVVGPAEWAEVVRGRSTRPERRAAGLDQVRRVTASRSRVQVHGFAIRRTHVSAAAEHRPGRRFGSARSSFGRLGFGRLGFGRLGFRRLGFGRLGFGRLGFGRLGFRRLGFGRLGFGRPGIGRIDDGLLRAAHRATALQVGPDVRSSVDARERHRVVGLALARGHAAGGDHAGPVALPDQLDEIGRRSIPTRADVEDRAGGLVDEQSAPGPVDRETSGRVRADRTVAGQLTGSVVQPEERPDPDRDVDPRPTSRRP